MKNLMKRHLKDVAQSNAKVKVIFHKALGRFGAPRKLVSLSLVILHNRHNTLPSVYLKELPLGVSLNVSDETEKPFS